MLVSLLLSLLAAVAAVAFAGRMDMAGRAERLAAASIVWLVLTQLPTFGLAWANRLYPVPLAAFVVSLSLGTLVLSGIGRSVREHARAIARDLLGLARMPVDGLVQLAAVRSPVFLGALYCALMVAWSGWLCYLAPPAGWDGLWYHDTIVAYAMQNHGFRLADISEDLWPVNSFPRMCENVGLFFVAFGDRRLVEFPSTVLAVPLFVGVYLLAQRYVEDRAYAIACACAVLLMPGMYLILRSTYIDLLMAAFYVLGLYFGTRPKLRLRDAWLAATAFGFLFGSKLTAFAMVPQLALLVVIRVLWHHGRARPVASAATIVGGAIWLLLVGAPSYIRNWAVFGSPVWPWGLNINALHIHWPGQGMPTVQGVSGPSGSSSLLATLFSTPVPGKAWPDTRQHGYGIATLAILIPLGLIALVKAARNVLVQVLSGDPMPAKSWNVLYTAIPALVWLPFSPDPYMARYNAHVVIVLVVATAWLLRGHEWLRLREGVAGAVIFVALMLAYWATPGWNISIKDVRDLYAMSTRQRAVAHVFDFLPEPNVAEAREQELQRGDVIAYGNGILFPALVWNESYSNRAVWVASALGPEQMSAKADEVGAKWLVVSNWYPEYSWLKSQSALWQEIGQLSTTSPAMIAFRRVGK